MLVNNLTWNSNQNINDKGIITEMTGLLKNTNYDSEKTSQFKSDDFNQELNAVLAITKSLPMEKRDENSTKTLTPKIMFRYAPGKMRDLSGEGTNLNTIGGNGKKEDFTEGIEIKNNNI